MFDGEIVKKIFLGKKNWDIEIFWPGDSPRQSPRQMLKQS